MEDYVNPKLTETVAESTSPAPEAPAPQPAATTPEPPSSQLMFTAGKWEFIFAAAVLLCSILLCNFIFYGGFHLGFALAGIGLIACSGLYLIATGHRFDWYSGSLIIVSLIITAGFGRSDARFVKFIMLLFLITAVNLALCLAAKQNRRSSGSFRSLLDAPRALFALGIGGMSRTSAGLFRGLRSSGSAGQKTGAVLAGLGISVPILIIMIPLLMNADAAFEGLMDLLPEIELEEYIWSGFLGFFLGWILYSRGVRLSREIPPTAAATASANINSLTMGTVLTMVCVLYLVYLFSQLAYFAGGFSGILPEEFTLAEYARRGFFEMSWLCAINLLLICGSVGLVRKEPDTPRYVRLCCLFIGAITLFLVAAASAKMFLYIGSYGLTSRRVLTEVIMLWLALTTLVVCLWLFVTRLPYMRIVVLSAMIMGAVVFWVDVDTFVARYNVNAYRSGRLETVDVEYLGTLNWGAVPYIHQLTEDPDPEISRQAKDILRKQNHTIDDFRDWNYDAARASAVLQEFHEKEDQAVYAMLRDLLGFEIPAGNFRKSWNYQPEMVNGQQFFQLQLSTEDGTALEEILAAAGWQELPLHNDLKKLVFGLDGKESFFTDMQPDGMSKPTTGYYLFTDLHPDAPDPSDPMGVTTRAYPRFWLVCFDTDKDRLYFFRLDATCQTAQSES